MITANRAAEIRAQCNAHWAERNEKFPPTRHWCPSPGDYQFKNPYVPNEEIGLMEQWEFAHKTFAKGDKYTTYLVTAKSIGTWTNLPLMRVTGVSRQYRQGYISGLRRKVYAIDICGRKWVGSTSVDRKGDPSVGLCIVMKFTGETVPFASDYASEIDDNECPFDTLTYPNIQDVINALIEQGCYIDGHTLTRRVLRGPDDSLLTVVLMLNDTESALLRSYAIELIRRNWYHGAFPKITSSINSDPKTA